MTQELQLNVSTQLRGIYQLTVLDKDGNVKEKTAPFSNLITNAGLDQLGSATITYMMQSCYVGTGTTAPAVTDTTLTSYLARYDWSTTPTRTNYLYVPGPPAYWSVTYSYTFPTGSATGTLSEIGVGQTTNPVGPVYQLFSHALIVDSFGAPTTITVLSTDQLVVSYTLQNYLNTTDSTASILIAGISYSVLWRLYLVGTVASMTSPVKAIASMSVTIDPISPITGPGFSNAKVSAPSPASAAYTNGSYYVSWTGTWSTSSPQTTSVQCAQIGTNFHSFQMQFTPFIPKTSFNALTLVINTAWARYP